MSDDALDGYPWVGEAAGVAPKAFAEWFGPSLEQDGRGTVADLSDWSTGTDKPMVHRPSIGSPSQAAVPFPKGTADHTTEGRVCGGVQGDGPDGAGHDFNQDAKCRGGASALRLRDGG